MAVPRLNRRKWVAAAVEAVKGTPESLTATDAAILAFDPVLNQGISFEDRAPAGLAMGRLAGVPGEYMGTATLRVELRGSGSAGILPLWATTLLAGCGLIEADAVGAPGVLSPVSTIDAQKTITLAVWEDGVRKTLAGACGTVTFEAEFGKRGFANFNFTGVWQTPVDEANPSPTHEPAIPSRFANASFSIGAVTPQISRFTIDLGNDVQLRPDVNVEAAVLHAYVANRLAGGSFDPEALKVADHDLFGQFIAGLEQALALTFGSTAGNQLTIAADKMQWIDPQTADRNGLLTHETGVQFNSTAGDDEISIAFA